MVGQKGGGQVLRRRGILAAAGAVVTAIAMKPAASPVRASTDTNFVASGGSGTAFSTASGSTYFNGANISASNIGLAAVGTGAYGVFGSSTNGNGIFGNSHGGHAVYGNLLAPADSGFAGVVGQGNGSGTFGLLGVSGSTVTASGGVGVQGQQAQYGVVGMVNNAPNTVAVYGNNTSTGANPTGVYGLSNKGTGVFGQTNASNQYGVLGTTTAVNSTAIAGIANTNGSSAFSGGTTNPNAFAAFFQGTTVVQGNFAVTGNKSAVVAHPRTGDHRLVYCVESPESWFEDFGEGTLSGGTATVRLDPDFTALIHTDTYHVFLTEYDGHNNLCVANRTASGFEVHAATATVSGTFSWRVVGKRADTKAERLGTFTMPKIALPDVSKFKAPETPTPATPKKP